MSVELQIICALAALSTGSTLWAISASWSARKAQASHSHRPSTKESVRAAVAQQRAIPKQRQMVPAQIAERVVASIRAGGLNDYAMIYADLESEVARWCRENNVAVPPAATMLEALTQTPGVRKKRTKLNKSSAEHAYVRSRQALHGITNDYPMLYWIDDVYALPVTGGVTRKGTGRHPCPNRVVAGTVTDRTGIGARETRRERIHVEEHRRAA
jgi:hypothetical protein